MFIKLERKLLAVLLLTIFLSHLPITYVNAQVVDTSGHDHNVNAVRWSHNGTFLASASRDETIRLWTPEGEFAKLIQSPIPEEIDIVLDIEWSPNDQYLAASGVNRTVLIWNMTSSSLRPQVISQKHFDYVKSIAWHPNATYNGLIATGGNDGYTRLWNASFPEYEKDTDGNNTKYLASSSVVKNLQTNTKNVKDLVWSSNGKYLSAVGQDGRHQIITKSFTDEYAILTETGFAPEKTNLTELVGLMDFGEPIYALDISDVGSVDGENSYYVYALQNQIVTYQAQGPFVIGSSVNALPDMQQVGQSVTVDCGGDCINMDLEISKDGNKVAIAAGQQVLVYPFSNGITSTTPLWQYSIADLADSSDNFDGSTKVVSVSWNPDNETLAFAAGPDVFAYNTATGEQVFRIEGTLPQTSNVILIGAVVILVLIVVYLVYRRMRKSSI